MHQSELAIVQHSDLCRDWNGKILILSSGFTLFVFKGLKTKPYEQDFNVRLSGILN